MIRLRNTTFHITIMCDYSDHCKCFQSTLAMDLNSCYTEHQHRPLEID